jgi:hypothetical protein
MSAPQHRHFGSALVETWDPQWLTGFPYRTDPVIPGCGDQKLAVFYQTDQPSEYVSSFRFKLFEKVCFCLVKSMAGQVL